jgi:hypothetical protein
VMISMPNAEYRMLNGRNDNTVYFRSTESMTEYEVPSTFGDAVRHSAFRIRH